MSLLEQLKNKRNKLNHTRTIVTTPTGERFVENHTSATPPVPLERQLYGFVVDTNPDNVPAEILTSFLYLGSQDAVSIENCTTYKFTHILSVGVNVDTTLLDSIVEHMYLPLLDLPETQLSQNNVLGKIFKFIDKAKQMPCGRILVHCNAGVSRSATIVIAYLMKSRSLSFEDAYNFVKVKRKCIQPNAGFLRQLKELHFE